MKRITYGRGRETWSLNAILNQDGHHMLEIVSLIFSIQEELNACTSAKHMGVHKWL